MNIISLLFDIEMVLSILVATMAIGGFLFTVKYRTFYSVYARSSILMGGISSMLHSYNFEYVRNALEPSEFAIVCILIQAMFSLSILLFTYTILRFKWKWQLDVNVQMLESCDSDGCPLKDPNNCPLIKTNK